MTRDFFSSDGKVIEKDGAIDSAVGYSNQYKQLEAQLHGELRGCNRCGDKFCKLDKAGLHRILNVEMIRAWVEALVSPSFMYLSNTDYLCSLGRLPVSALHPLLRRRSLHHSTTPFPEPLRLLLPHVPAAVRL